MDAIEKRGWIEAAKILAVDSNGMVICPKCKDAVLQFSDSQVGEDGVFERRIYCGKCGAENYMRLHKR